jgi:hypothetical protein
MVDEKITVRQMEEIKKELMGEIIQVENERRAVMARGKRDVMEMVVQSSEKAKNEIVNASERISKKYRRQTIE